MTVQFVLLLVSSSLCYNYYDYYDDDYDNSEGQYVSPDTLTVLLGSSFSLPCHGEGDRRLHHNSLAYEGEGGYNGTTSSYFIPAAGEEHTGLWVCGDSSTQLAVMPGLDRAAILLQDRLLLGRDNVVTVREEELLQPLCVAASSRSSMTESDLAYWRVGTDLYNKSEVRVRLDGEERKHVMLSMEVMQVRREHNQLELECSLQGLTASLRLEVEFPPQFTISRQPNFGTPIVTQSSVSLLCTVDSNPASEIFWEKDGAVVARTAELSLVGVGEEEQGWYQCNANHKLGNYSSVGYYLAIKEPEDINMSLPCLSSEQPSVMTPQHNISTTRGHNVTIYSKYCSALPVTATIWSGPNVLIRQGETRGRFRTAVVARETETCTTVSLVIGDVTDSDTGQYLLVVSSEAGAGQGLAWLEVRPGEEKVVATSGGGELPQHCDTLSILLVVTLLLPSTCYQ